MKDPIERQAAIDEIDEWIKAFRENGHKESAADACLIQDGIIQLPSAQAERKHGYWIESHEHVYMCNEVKEWTNWYCSECDAPNSWPTDYCPNCGARMEADDESN